MKMALRHFRLQKVSRNKRETIFIILVIASYCSLTPIKTNKEVRLESKNCSHVQSKANNNSFLHNGNISKVHNGTRNEKSDQNRNSSLPNGTLRERNRHCVSGESRAICHTYFHNMYRFYSTIGGFLMLAIVVTGISFLIVTHFHGRHIVKTNQHIVAKIAKWDVIQHRKQQSRERTNNWI